MERAKIMVSIPDEMFSELDPKAKPDHRSRSELIEGLPEMVLPRFEGKLDQVAFVFSL